MSLEWRADCASLLPPMRPLQRHRLGRIELAPLMETAGDGTIRPLQEEAPIGAGVTIQGAGKQDGGLDHPPPWGAWRWHQLAARRISGSSLFQ